MLTFHDPISSQPTGKQTSLPTHRVFPTCGVLAAVVKKNVSDTADHPSERTGEGRSPGGFLLFTVVEQHGDGEVHVENWKNRGVSVSCPIYISCIIRLRIYLHRCIVKNQPSMCIPSSHDPCGWTVSGLRVQCRRFVDGSRWATKKLSPLGSVNEGKPKHG